MGNKTAYKIVRFLLIVFMGLFMPYRTKGKENLPEGAALICANHSHWSDPFYMAFAVPGKYHLCIMGKKEIFKNKLLSWILRSIGMFPVDREHVDLDAMKNALSCLKNGKKLGIFPEGTRRAEDNEVSPKAGAVRMAEKTGAPLVPVHIPRKKKFLRRVQVTFGEPIFIEKAAARRTKADYEALAEELMARIQALGEPSKAGGQG